MTAFADKTLLVGVGAPKCGTSWLYGYLRDHPQIFMSPIKEMHVFNAWYRPDVCAAWNDRFAAKLEDLESKAAPLTPQQERMLTAHRARVAMSGDLGAYIDYFRAQARDEHRAFGESSPAYNLLREEGFAALRAQHPRVRLIFLMRDPVERFWSALRMRQKKRDNFDARAEFVAAWSDAALVERSRYDLTLEALDRAFPADEVWIGFYETLFRADTISKICAFAGVDAVPADFDNRPNLAPDVDLSPERRAIARALLDPVYAYCRARFGVRLPREWLV